MKIGIVGYRYFTDYKKFCEYISEIQKYYPIDKWDLIISGQAQGADTLAKKYADDNNIDCIEFPAQWLKYGSPKAAHVRNQLIVNHSDIIIAFVSKKSKGTYDTIRRAKEKKKILYVIEID